MKLNLYLAFAFISTYIYAQTPISNYNSLPESAYTIVTSSPPIDQSAAGFVTWTFNNLSPIGSSLDTYALPTASELTNYPGTTNVATVTRDANVSRTFIKKVSGITSITGAQGEGLTLNYNTNNALIGTFPLNYGYTNVDNSVSGTYLYDTYTGTFSGSFTTSVDAYGTLILNNLGSGAFNGSVTRLKTIQNISLNYGFLTGVGTATQTSYNYYAASSVKLVFRTTTASISVPLLSINNTANVIEALQLTTLTASENIFSTNNLVISPNPVKDNLNFKLLNSTEIVSIIIRDLNGRQILKAYTNMNSIAINQLELGIYIVTVNTTAGSISKKFIKQ